MKRLSGICLVLLFITAAPAYSADLAAPGTAARKLQRGFLNIAFSPMEVTNKIVDLKKEDTALPSWIAGSAKGTFYTAARALTGVYEILTAPFPLPADYAPVMKPEFAWEYKEGGKKA